MSRLHPTRTRAVAGRPGHRSWRALGLALALAWLAQVPAGDAALLMVLAASASYIAVPAVVRYAIPEADPSLYVSLSLGVTFPLNILVGIPLYTHLAMTLP